MKTVKIDDPKTLAKMLPTAFLELILATQDKPDQPVKMTVELDDGTIEVVVTMRRK
jgi:hypothetical protein